MSESDRGVISILLMAGFVVILNETTMNVALTSIMIDFGVSERLAQWLTTAFLLTMSVVIPVTGWLIDRLPTRSTFLLAMLLFSFGTLTCAVAPGFSVLVLGRIVQATGTAVVLPLLMTTVMRLVSADSRGAVMGKISMVIAVAPALGPTVSGLVLQRASWRMIFVLMLPITAAIVVIGYQRLRNVGQLQRNPLDVVSVALAVLAFAPIVYGLSLLGDSSVAFWLPWVTIGSGMIFLAGFIIRQILLGRHGSPLLNLTAFRYGTFTLSVVLLALSMMGMLGTIIMLPLLLQQAYGWSALSVGLLVLPGGIIMGLLGPIIGQVYDQLGPRLLVLPASLVVGAVFIVFATFTLATPWWLILLGHVVFSVALAHIFTPAFTAALGSLPSELYAHGSAIVSTLQQVAGAVGTAVFITIFASQSAVASGSGATPTEALLSGARGAFIGAAILWLGTILAACFVRKPDLQVSQ